MAHQKIDPLPPAPRGDDRAAVERFIDALPRLGLQIAAVARAVEEQREADTKAPREKLEGGQP